MGPQTEMLSGVDTADLHKHTEAFPQKMYIYTFIYIIFMFCFAIFTISHISNQDTYRMHMTKTSILKGHNN